MTDFISTTEGTITGALTGTTLSSSVVTYHTNGAAIQLVADDIEPESVDYSALGKKNSKTLPKRNVIHPRLYFSYVKSKLTRSEKTKLTNRLKKLTYLLDTARPINQKALVETLEKEIVNLYREQEAAVCGYDQHVLKEHIEKFRSQVKTGSKTIVFAELEKFPRPIPKEVREEIKKAKEKEVFDEFWVLFYDQTGQPAKTNKDRIREKDPILFGKFLTEPNKFYFITDWEDEVCDLTFDKFVDKVRSVDADFFPETVKEIKPAQMEKIKKAVQERDNRLSITSVSNYRSLMVEEDKKSTRYFKRLWNAIRGKG